MKKNSIKIITFILTSIIILNSCYKEENRSLYIVNSKPILKDVITVVSPCDSLVEANSFINNETTGYFNTVNKGTHASTGLEYLEADDNLWSNKMTVYFKNFPTTSKKYNLVNNLQYVTNDSVACIIYYNGHNGSNYYSVTGEKLYVNITNYSVIVTFCNSKNNNINGSSEYLTGRFVYLK